MKKIIIIFIILLMPSVAFGADYYVDLDKGTAGDGSIGDAWNTFAQAKKSSGTVANGDTVYVQGTTSTVITLASGDSGASGSVIKYVAWAGESTPIIDGTGQGTYAGMDFGDGTNYLTFDGLHIRDWDNGGVKFSSATTTPCEYIIFQNCSIYDNPGPTGIWQNVGKLRNFTIDNCDIYNNSDVVNGGHGIYLVECYDCVIKDSRIYNNYYNNIQLQSRLAHGASHYIDGMTIERNDIYDAQNGHGVRVSEYAGTANTSIDVLFKNNRIWSNARSGVHWEAQMTSNAQYNDALWANGEGGITTTSPTSALIVRNVAAWGNTTTQIDTTTITHSNNHTASNPWLSIDDASGDFLNHDNGSALYNTGYGLSGIVDVDHDEVSRPQVTSWDIGAHEYTAAVPPTGTWVGVSRQ